ncbi:MAG: cytochrome c family protein [Tistlia sp.]|uniref:cytochrome c family protein n=1 Tax=Tistlia sp. TaxID=3057121 RepID=UPI0034A1484A
MRKALLTAAGLLLAFAVQPASAEGDAAAGEKVFARCKACHTVDEGGASRVGPNLHGVVGRPAAAKEGFKYSKAMTEAGEGGLVWSEEDLAKYLADPRGFIKGNRMAFPGLRKQDELDNVIAYLKSNG